MTKEEIIEMAKQAGFERLGHTAEDWVCHLEDIEEFTKLVAEKAIKEALAQPKQEPMAWFSTGPARMFHWTSDKPAYGDDWVPLYTTPPQREFVGLTDEERDEICLGDESIARSIEAKLREKNGGNHGS